MRKETQPENKVKRDAIKQLEALGWFVWKTEQAHMRGRKFNGTYGVPDINAMKNGVYIAVECKTETGIQSKEQILFEKNLNDHGGFYFLFRGGHIQEIDHNYPFV